MACLNAHKRGDNSNENEKNERRIAPATVGADQRTEPVFIICIIKLPRWVLEFGYKY